MMYIKYFILKSGNCSSVKESSKYYVTIMFTIRFTPDISSTNGYFDRNFFKQQQSPIRERQATTMEIQSKPCEKGSDLLILPQQESTMNCSC